MTYRWPIFTGDRVATAPHTDLFMAGCRFGIVTEITRVAALYDARLYRVEFEGAGHGKVANLRADSLLGAVNARPGDAGSADVSGATGSTEGCGCGDGPHHPSCPNREG